MSSVALSPLASLAPHTPKKADTSAPTTSSSSSSATSDQTSLNSLGTTFMQLLVQELQNQDPTAPMDSTQMVGQMISLNELDQVASINQLLTQTLGSSSTATATQGTSSATPPTSHNQGMSSTHALPSF